MKQILFIFIALLIVNSILAQVVRDHRDTKTTKPTVDKTTNPTADKRPNSPYSQQIILFEAANFGGRTKALGVGQYRLNDFNDITSSIRIPDGLGVIIFEHADVEGGYGIWVDIGADLADLAQLDFNDKVSYINVFSREKTGYTWISNCLVNGIFVAAHWERKRANGTVDPACAPLVAPPIVRNIVPQMAQPHSEDANIGYGELSINLGDHTPFWMRDNWVDLDAGDVKVVNAVANIDPICPQHRSVGELSALALPKKSYQVLEGIVRSSGMAGQDFPTSHYTHDFTFNVVPDPAYHFLLADHIVSPGLNGVGWVRADSQEDIEVEWESGLAQDNVLDGVANPATANNRYGSSYGFFSAGHNSKDEIWNWPADGDRIHTEGLWIWERGHPPAHTEIHPAHFVAVQRKHPVSFILDATTNPVIRNQPDDRFIATRVDVFASGDGGPMFNTKGLNPGFNQVTDMNRKDYTFTIKHPFTNVIPQMSNLHKAVLQCKFIKQKGDNFPAGADPVIRILADNEVQVTIPWRTKNIANTAIFARTFLVYWDDIATNIFSSTTKVLEAEKPKLYHIDLIKINLIEKRDLENDRNRYGNFRIFCNVGNTWIFLNEFTDQTDGVNILSTGLGNSENINSFMILKGFNVYVPATTARLNNNIVYSNLQVRSMGWEADGVDIFMGHIINAYSRDKEVVNKFFGEHLLYLDKHDGADDAIGSINKLMNPLLLDQEKNTGLQTLHAKYTDDKNVSHNVFDIVYQIREITFPSINNNQQVISQ